MKISLPELLLGKPDSFQFLPPSPFQVASQLPFQSGHLLQKKQKAA